jgi:hypothetical protein
MRVSHGSQGEPERLLSVCGLMEKRILYDRQVVTVRGAWVRDIENSAFLPAEGACQHEGGEREGLWLTALPGVPGWPNRPQDEAASKANAVAAKYHHLYGWAAIVTVTGRFEVSSRKSGQGVNLGPEYPARLIYSSRSEPVWITRAELARRLKTPVRKSDGR